MIPEVFMQVDLQPLSDSGRNGLSWTPSPTLQILSCPGKELIIFTMLLIKSVENIIILVSGYEVPFRVNIVNNYKHQTTTFLHKKVADNLRFSYLACLYSILNIGGTGRSCLKVQQ